MKENNNMTKPKPKQESKTRNGKQKSYCVIGDGKSETRIDTTNEIRIPLTNLEDIFIPLICEMEEQFLEYSVTICCNDFLITMHDRSMDFYQSKKDTN